MTNALPFQLIINKNDSLSIIVSDSELFGFVGGSWPLDLVVKKTSFPPWLLNDTILCVVLGQTRTIAV